MGDKIEFALRGFCPGLKDFFALLGGAVNALARRSAYIDARNLLPDKHLSLLGDNVVINAAVVVERRVSGRDKAFEFFDFHFLLPLLVRMRGCASHRTTFSTGIIPFYARKSHIDKRFFDIM
jgi:hypothetical protein